MFKNILFDLDGTLINTNELIIETFQYTLKKHLGLEVTAEMMVPFFGEPLIETLRRFDPGRADDMLRTYRQYNLEKHDQLTTLFPGTVETLSRLKRAGFKLGVVTSKMRLTATRGIHLFGLDRFLDVVVTFEDTERHKPLGDPIEKALTLLPGLPETSLMVGDSPFDLKCARNAGVKCAAALWSIIPQHDLIADDPDYLLEKIYDLLPICLIEGVSEC